MLRRGILIDWTGDVNRIENVQFHSHFWFHPSTNGNWDNVFNYMQQHLEAFILEGQTGNLLQILLYFLLRPVIALLKQKWATVMASSMG